METGPDIKNFFDKVYGCWLGKIIGGTLGFPIESGEMAPGNLEFYYHIPDGGRGDDDTDVQIIRHEGLMEYNKLPDEVQLAQEWIDKVKYPWCEYGDGAFNFKRGLLPPLTGSFDNYFGDCMGATTRTEIWAMLFPGVPEKAATQMYKETIFDHYGDGLYISVFLAAAQSIAFVENDLKKILNSGQSFIPVDSSIYKVISDVFSLYESKTSWDKAKKEILEKYYHPEESHTLQNIGVICLSLLYGDKDFEKTLLYAVNCGCDADTTGAKVASFLGIINGASSIPEKWKGPIKDTYSIDWGIISNKKKYKISDLAEETTKIFDKYQKLSGIENKNINLKDDLFKLYRNKSKVKLNSYSNLGFELDYKGLPTIGYNKAKEITLSLLNRESSDFIGEIILLLPKNWKVNGLLQSKIKLNPYNNPTEFTFKVMAGDDSLIKTSNEVLIYILNEGKVIEIIPFVLIGEGIWYIIGPFGDEKSDNLNEIFEAERIQDINRLYSKGSGKKLKFKRYSFPEKHIDLNVLKKKEKEEAIFALTYFYTPEDREAKLQFASTDAYKVWHNETLLLKQAKNSEVLSSINISSSDFYLRAGWNKFLIKLVRRSSNNTFRFFITDRSGTYNFGMGMDGITNTYIQGDH